MDINIDPKAARWEVSRLFSFEPVIVFLILISPTGLYARNQKMNSLRPVCDIPHVSLRYMVSPFAYLKWLDWIEIGVGLTYEYRNAIPMS